MTDYPGNHITVPIDQEMLELPHPLAEAWVHSAVTLPYFSITLEIIITLRIPLRKKCPNILVVKVV